jgi:hypothetical protein
MKPELFIFLYKLCQENQVTTRIHGIQGSLQTSMNFLIDCILMEYNSLYVHQTRSVGSFHFPDAYSIKSYVDSHSAMSLSCRQLLHH